MEWISTHRVNLHVGTVPSAHTQLHRDVAMAFFPQWEGLPAWMLLFFSSTCKVCLNVRFLSFCPNWTQCHQGRAGAHQRLHGEILSMQRILMAKFYPFTQSPLLIQKWQKAFFFLICWFLILQSVSFWRLRFSSESKLPLQDGSSVQIAFCVTQPN